METYSDSESSIDSELSNYSGDDGDIFDPMDKLELVYFPVSGNDSVVAAESQAGSTDWKEEMKFHYPKDFIRDIGVVNDFPPGSSEFSYYKYMLGGDKIFQVIADNTNKYAKFTQQLAGKIDQEWFETTPEEIVAYIGILIYMGVYDLSETTDYWYNPDIDCSMVKNCMTYKRYRNITKYLHISDIEKEKQADAVGYDVLQKVRPVLDIMDNFHNKYRPGRELVIDEAMVAFKRHHHIKQYVKNKPIKWGFKVWVLATPHGYVLKGNVYLGRKEIENKGIPLGSQVVMNLLDNYLGFYHHVYFDSFFSSVQLVRFLLQNDTYVCATTLPSREEWPKDLKIIKSLKLKRGECRCLQSNGVTATVWFDNRYICVLSSNCDPRVNVNVLRKTGKGNEKQAIPCPLPVARYTTFMGGVDRADQKRSYHSLGRKTKKWWKYLFGFVLNTAVVNSFILYNESQQPGKSKNCKTQKEFRKELYRQMIGNFSSRKRIGLKRNGSSHISFSQQPHKVIKIEGRKKVCVLCSQKKRHTTSGRGVQTTWKCKNCDLPLCKIGCFLEFHQEKGVEVDK